LGGLRLGRASNTRSANSGRISGIFQNKTSAGNRQSTIICDRVATALAKYASHSH
jgi:hypothetical protein